VCSSDLDDDTDEDIFSLALPEKVLAVRVGQDVDSRADYFPRDQAEIDRVLEVIVGPFAGTPRAAS
jgi:hypothetical protein